MSLIRLKHAFKKFILTSPCMMIGTTGKIHYNFRTQLMVQCSGKDCNHVHVPFVDTILKTTEELVQNRKFSQSSQNRLKFRQKN